MYITGKTHENSVTTFFQIYLLPLDFILFFRNILVHCYLGKVTRIQTEWIIIRIFGKHISSEHTATKIYWKAEKILDSDGNPVGYTNITNTECTCQWNSLLDYCYQTKILYISILETTRSSDILPSHSNMIASAMST